MKVIQLGPYPPPHGGVQTNLVAIRDHLLATGHECGAVNLTRNRKEDGGGVYYPKSAGELTKLLWKLKADILHLHYGGDLSRRLLGLLFFCTLLPGRKTVLTFHSGGYPSSPAGQTAGWLTLRGFLFRRLSGVIAVNGEIAAMFRKFGVPQKRIRTILPFVVQPPDPAVVLPEHLAAFFAAHSPVLLTVGLLEPEYDLGMQIDVMGDVIARYPKAGLVIAGSGSLEGQLREQIASKPWARNILLYGDMPHPVTIRATVECDAMLRTTLYDGDSVSVREALYLGTPVIATETGMRPEGVISIPLKNPADSLRTAICDVAARGRLRTPPKGDGQENVRAVTDFYRELVG
jgi:glycosyltransferase involved in cell wall biosynthesis